MQRERIHRRRVMDKVIADAAEATTSEVQRPVSQEKENEQLLEDTVITEGAPEIETE